MRFPIDAELYGFDIADHRSYAIFVSLSHSQHPDPVGSKTAQTSERRNALGAKKNWLLTRKRERERSVCV